MKSDYQLLRLAESEAGCDTTPSSDVHGVTIYQTGSYFHTEIWNEKRNETQEIRSKDLWQVKQLVEEVTASNMFKTLMLIKDHYAVKSDIQKPEQFLEDLRTALAERMMTGFVNMVNNTI